MASRRYLPIATAAVLGALASCCVLALSLRWQLRIDRLEFESRARSELAMMNSEVQDAASLIETLKDFFQSTQAPVSRDEFARFSEQVHGRAIGLRDVGWAPRVIDAEREQFERQIRASGLDGFEIKARDQYGHLVRAERSPEYYPIVYLDGNPASRPVLGFNLATGPERQSALDRAVATGQTAATPPLKLLTVAHPRGGMMSFMPVYRGGRDPDATPRPKPDGIVFGAFEIAALVDTVIARSSRFDGIDIYLFDLNGSFEDRGIYWRSAALEAGAAPTEQTLRTRRGWEGRLSIIDQQWGVIFTPAGAAAGTRWTWYATAPFLTGLLLTGMTVLYLALSLRRTTQLETLTSELRETTVGLHRTAENVAHMARHDALTGLPNRRLFFDELERSSKRAMAGELGFAVLQIDLDRFKPVNDRYGHAVGDCLLREVASRLRAVSRGRDVLARLGGDEFAAIVEYDDLVDGCGRYASRILKTLAQPIMLDGIELDIGASIGIAVAPRDGTDPEALLHAADMAMYAAKRQGRGAYRFHEAGMNTATPAPGRLLGDAEMREPA